MQAYLTHAFGSPSHSSISHIEKPQISDTQLLVRVHYASLNPIDWKTRKGLGWAAELLKDRLPRSLGMDFSGEVAEVGQQLKYLWQVGERVCGIQNIAEQCGSFAEYIVVETADLVAVPDELSLQQAAGLPLAGLTAWQSIAKLRLRASSRCLVNGVAGGVGHIMAQIIRGLGCEVYGTCSDHNSAKVAQLGVKPINYRDQRLMQSYADYFQVLFDAVGGAAAEKALQTVKAGGSVLTLPTLTYEQVKALGQSRNITVQNILVTMDRLVLSALLALLEKQKLVIWIDQIYEFEQIAEAIEQSETGRVAGKILIKVIQ